MASLDSLLNELSSLRQTILTEQESWNAYLSRINSDQNSKLTQKRSDALENKPMTRLRLLERRLKLTNARWTELYARSKRKAHNPSLPLTFGYLLRDDSFELLGPENAVNLLDYWLNTAEWELCYYGGLAKTWQRHINEAFVLMPQALRVAFQACKVMQMEIELGEEKVGGRKERMTIARVKSLLLHLRAAVACVGVHEARQRVLSEFFSVPSSGSGLVRVEQSRVEWIFDSAEQLAVAGSGGNGRGGSDSKREFSDRDTHAAFYVIDLTDETQTTITDFFFGPIKDEDSRPAKRRRFV